MSMAGPAVAQLASLEGPVSGFLYLDSSHSVRPLLGVPGSLVIGPILLGDLDSAFLAPGGKWAVIAKDGRTKLVRELSERSLSEARTEGLIDAVDRVAWSRDGMSAAIYSSSSGQLQRVRLYGSDALVDSPVDLAWQGKVNTLAISPNGKQIAVGATGAGLYLVEDGQSTALLSPIARPAAAVFDETGRRLYVVDLDTQRILEFDSGSGATEFAVLEGADGLPLKPVGMAVSAGGTYVLLVDGPTRAVRFYETTSRTLVRTIQLDFAPTRFEAVSATPSFLLNGDNIAGWLRILDAGQSPSIYFVPASQEEQR